MTLLAVLVTPSPNTVAVFAIVAAVLFFLGALVATFRPALNLIQQIVALGLTALALAVVFLV
jgi:hypothetical protein